MTIDDKLYLSRKSVARLIDCSESHIVHLTRDGLLPMPVRLGNLTRWPRDAVLEALDKLATGDDDHAAKA